MLSVNSFGLAQSDLIKRPLLYLEVKVILYSNLNIVGDVLLS